MSDRLADLSTTFAENRDAIYRKQLQVFQADIHYINSAALYSNKCLEEYGDEQTQDGNVSAAASIHGGLRTIQQAQSNGASATLKTGRHTASFIEDVNDAMEQRDADLLTIAYRHNYNIDHLEKDYKYSVAVAHKEHQRLLETMRQRLIANVHTKKATLIREKEKLDIADTNALLHHPNQFSLHNGASPGGPQSNRKTRHTRHRLEVDDLDIAANGTNKRKRKAPAIVDTENGSPAPTSRDNNDSATNGHKIHEARQEAHQITAPLYNLDRLFSDRELTTHLQQASFEVIQDFATKRRKLTPSSQSAILAITTSPTSLEENPTTSGPPHFSTDGTTDDVFLAAPEMERTATNQSYHATRSTKNTAMANSTSFFEKLGPELAGRYAAAEILGTHHMRREKDKKDEENRAPGLSELEIHEDVALIRKAMETEEAGVTFGGNGRLVEEICGGERQDFIGGTEVAGV